MELAARHVVLIGLMGSGKSTIGAALAERLGRPFLDNDQVLAAMTGRQAREFAAAEGPDALQRAETDALAHALASSTSSVIAAAAGAAAADRAPELLAGHDVVYLRADPSVLQPRIRGQAGATHRPHYDLGKQFPERDPVYRALATIVVDAAAPPDVVVGEISSALASR